MVKKCSWENCETEIQEWQAYCPKHYAMKMQEEGKPVKQIKEVVKEEFIGVSKTEPTPVQPVQKQEQMIDIEEPSPKLKKVKVEGETVKPKPTIEPKKIVVFHLPTLVGKERLIVKQTAFKGAIQIMTELVPIKGKDFGQVVNEIETLTVMFYKLIVRENEKSE